MGNLAR